MTTNRIILTGKFKGQTLRVEVADFGHVAMSGQIFAATVGRTGTKTYAVNGDFSLVDSLSERTQAILRGGRARGELFVDEQGREFALSHQVVIRNRHGRIVGLVEDIDVTTVLPYYSAAA